MIDAVEAIVRLNDIYEVLRGQESVGTVKLINKLQ